MAGRFAKATGDAASGGKHAGFLNNVLKQTTGQLSKGIKSLDKQIAKHTDMLANPGKHVEGFDKLSTKQQQGLLNKWKKEIQNFTEQKEILTDVQRAKEAQ